MSFGIRGKIIFLSLGIVFLLTAIVFYLINFSLDLRNSVKYIGEERVQVVNLVGELKSSNNALPRFLWLSMAMPINSPERNKALDKADQSLKTLEITSKNLKKYKLSKTMLSNMNDTDALINKLKVIVEKISNDIRTSNSLKKDELIKNDLIQSMPPVALKITSNIEELSSINIQETNNEIYAINSKTDDSLKRTALFVFITLLIALVVSYYFAKTISSKLINITEDVKDSNEHLAESSRELAASSESLASSAQEQASAVQETSSSVAEISGMIENNLMATEECRKLTNEIFNSSNVTLDKMNELNRAMNLIQDSNAKIEGLITVIDSIAEKTSIIDDIVFKTQLLSFNASVEAERAGEHGRGFAVVAQEVGNLALISGKAASDISSIVKLSLKEVNDIARENKKRVETGEALTLDVNDKLNYIKSQANEIKDSTNKILVASKEQSQGINQISLSIDSINQAVQETAKSSEEIANASTSLFNQGHTMLNLVSELNKIVTGNVTNSVHQEKNILKFNKPEKSKNKTFNNKSYKKVANSSLIDPNSDEWENV